MASVIHHAPTHHSNFPTLMRVQPQAQAASHAADAHAMPQPKQPCSSFLRMRYPFSSSPSLRELYTQGADHDVAHWMEDMDTFAGETHVRG